MTSVFLVTKSSYSDYSIVGAFSTKEKAQKTIDTLSIYDVNDAIDEYKLDELDTLVKKIKRGYKVYWIMMKSDGNVEQCSDSKEIGLWLNHSKDKGMIWGYVLAKNDVQAVKIVNDKRAQLIARGEL